MIIKEICIDDLIPYKNNPRIINDEAVQKVAESIKQFGFKVPIVIDKEDVIVTGHTRYKAAQMLGLETVPCIIADDLTEEQVKLFRLADNKVSEYSAWDFIKLELELAEFEQVEFEPFGFEHEEILSDEDIDNMFENDDKTDNQNKKTIICPHCGEIITL